VKTTTQEIREIRKIAVELLLADHEKTCPTCSKSATCQLQAIARRLGVDEVRFKSDPRAGARGSQLARRSCATRTSCILCGDCVRVCHEIQGIGAIDFAHRGRPRP
jgi:NADH-quinone oxidoreductase subunit G